MYGWQGKTQSLLSKIFMESNIEPFWKKGINIHSSVQDTFLFQEILKC